MSRPSLTDRQMYARLIYRSTRSSKRLHPSSKIGHLQVLNYWTAQASTGFEALWFRRAKSSRIWVAREQQDQQDVLLDKKEAVQDLQMYADLADIGPK